MFEKKSITDVDVRGKRVLVRVDFNVPVSDGRVTDDTRIRAALPTLQYLTGHGASVILLSHLGRPSGTGYEEQYSLAPTAKVLSRLMHKKVIFVEDLCGKKAHEAAAALEPHQIMMLENTRFDSREKKNDPELSKSLASLADLYVDDAFGSAHRAHCSTVGVADYLPAVAGFLLQNEITTLTGLLTDPEHPFIAVLGGSKVSDKIGVIDNLLDTTDTLLIGGGMCFTFLKALGYDTGKSLLEANWVERAGVMIDKARKKDVNLLLPVDIVVADKMAVDARIETVAADAIPADMMGLDIGPQTCALYQDAICEAKTVFWNGPMGVFEMKPFENGTRKVAEAIAAAHHATSIIGGGDSVAALKQFRLEGRVTFTSTGGGASMEILEGKELPGVDCLADNDLDVAL